MGSGKLSVKTDKVPGPAEGDRNCFFLRFDYEFQRHCYNLKACIASVVGLTGAESGRFVSVICRGNYFYCYIVFLYYFQIRSCWGCHVECSNGIKLRKLSI